MICVTIRSMRNILKPIVVGVVFAVTLLFFTGCAAEAPSSVGKVESKVAEAYIEPANPKTARGTGWYSTGDGRAVWCIYFGVQSGYSCDWENAKKVEN